jgi:hypothetical protein
MTNKFSKKAFTPSQGGSFVEEGEGFLGGTNTFIRSKKDNTLFKDLQVDNIKNLYTEEVIVHIDADSIAYKSASAIEDDFVEVVNNKKDDTTKEGLFVPSGITFKNKTEFKGAARTEGKITAGSYLDIINVKREAEGLDLYTLDDFEILPKKKLKYEKGATIEGLTFKNSKEVLFYFMDNWIECIKKQTQIDNVKLYLGEGKVHRHFILLPKRYKEARVDLERPLLLKEAREYLLENYNSELAPEGLEADERVDAAAFTAYLNYRKTGRINGIKASIDKDNWNTAGFSFNYTKDFHFQFPQIIKIDSTDLTVGCLEWCGDELKGTGLLFTALQLCLEDGADGYGSRLFLPKEMKQGINYGSKSFYKDFVHLTTPNEVLQKVVDKFAEWFPHGVRYTAWDGTEVDENTIDWLQKCFQCVYMTRKENDPTTIHHLLKRFKVDTSKIENNNLLTSPYKVFNTEFAEELLTGGLTSLKELKTDELKSYKSLNKGGLVERLDSTLVKVDSLIEGIEAKMFKLVQKNKQTGEIIDYVEGE